MARRKGYAYHCTRQAIREHLRLTTKQKLEWLEAANRICKVTLRGKKLRVWEKFRAGEI